MAPLDVTVAVVPRERFSLTKRSLENLYAQTTKPFKLVYVNAGAPRSVRRYLQDASDKHGFRLIDIDRFVSPNQARNIALGEVSTKYVVFVDNDALVTAQWLEHLVQCAEETGAWIVGPLYLIGEIDQQMIHMAGGSLHFKESDGQRIAYDEHRLGDVPLRNLTQPLQRGRCDFVEFHCMLLRTDLFNRLGPLDEGLFSLHEHIDIGWAARKAGGSVYLEPAAVTSYVAPPPFEWSDLPFFMLRWHDNWTKASVQRFNEKWGVATTRHFGDEDSSLDLEDTAVRWARAHRRLAAGMQIPSSGDEGVESAVEQARLMIGLLLSVDRDGFDLALTTADDEEMEATNDITPERMLDCLPELVARADRDRLNVLIRPRPARRSQEPALVRVDLDPEGLKDVDPYAFLTLQTGPDRYEAWIAVDTSSWRSASIMRRLTSASLGGANPFRRLAGSPVSGPDQRAGDFHRVILHKGVAGSATTGMNLEDSGLLPRLWSSHVF